jgi:hypothetical protein
MTEWIDASEWLPEDGRVYLVCDAINRIDSFGIHIGDIEWELMAMHEMTEDVCITHWMERPTLPDYEEEE